MNKRNDDISNKTVLAMLIIVIIVSLISLWIYLDALGKVTRETAMSKQTTSLAEKADPKIDDGARGIASIEIIKPSQEEEK